MPTSPLLNRAQVALQETWRYCDVIIGKQSSLHKMPPASCEGQYDGGPELKGSYQILSSRAEIDFEALYASHWGSIQCLSEKASFGQENAKLL
jgi:hypothetical protein